MRPLSAALIAELGLTGTRPGWLVEVHFSTVLRLSSLGDVIWSGQSWAGYDVAVHGLTVDAGGAQSARLVLGDADLAVSALVLTEGVAMRRVVVRAIYAGATAAGDVETLLDGAAGACELDADAAKVRLDMVGGTALRTSLPRRRINAASGFTRLIPSGTPISVNGERYVIERR